MIRKNDIIIVGVHLQMVDFGSWQGSSVFATAGIVCLFRGLQKSENAARGRKMPFVDVTLFSR